MRIQYETKFRDIFLFSTIHQYFSVVIQSSILFGCVLMFFSELNRSGVGFALAIAIFTYLFLWLLQILFGALYLYSRSNVTVLTTHTIEIQEDAFFEETKYNRSYFFWHGVLKIVRRPGFVAVYVAPHMAHVIPTRAFESKSQLNEFLRLVDFKIKSNKLK